MTQHPALLRCIWIAAILSLLLTSPVSAATNPSEAQATPTSACSTTPGGSLLAAPGFTNGKPDPGLNVIDPATGKTVRTIAMPAVQSGLPAALPNHALVETLDGDIYVIDATSGIATKIAPPAGATTSLSLSNYRFADSAGIRWALLGDAGLTTALLVDLQTGQATDLKALLAGKSTSPMIAAAAISPDDAHVLIWDGIRLFLAKTADPAGSLRALGGDMSNGGSFSPNGKEVVYTDPERPATPQTGTTTRRVNLVVENVETGSRKVVGSSPHLIRARWIDQHQLGVDQIVDAGSAKLSRFSVLNLETGGAISILPYSVNPGGLIEARDGRWLLHEHEDGDNRLYEWVDLKTGTLTSLPTLTNLFPVGNPGARWTVFFDPKSTTGADGASYVGFDFETGRTTTEFEQKTGDLYQPVTRISADGRFAALEAFHGSETQLWLLDNQQGTSRQVTAQGNISSVAFSPDNCWLAISSLSGTGTSRSSNLALEPLQGGQLLELSQGLAPIWLNGH